MHSAIFSSSISINYSARSAHLLRRPCENDSGRQNPMECLVMEYLPATNMLWQKISVGCLPCADRNGAQTASLLVEKFYRPQNIGAFSPNRGFSYVSDGRSTLAARNRDAWLNSYMGVSLDSAKDSIKLSLLYHDPTRNPQNRTDKTCTLSNAKNR